MTPKTRSRSILALAALVAAAGIGLLLADDERRFKAKTRIVVTDADGEPYEETFEWDAEHPPPFLGVGLERTADGARVTHVVEDSPAARAGVREGDVIVSIDGADIDTPGDVTRGVWARVAGETVRLEVERDGSRRTIDAQLAEGGTHGFFGDFDFGRFEERMERMQERFGEMDFDFRFDGLDEDGMHRLEERLEELSERMEGMNFHFAPHLGGNFHFRGHRPVLGVELVGVTPELRRHLGARDDEGVLVGRVVEGSAAEEAGIAVGDLILEIDGEPIGDVSDLRRALADRAGESFGVQVLRDGAALSLTVTLPEVEERGHDRRFRPASRNTSIHT